MGSRELAIATRRPKLTFAHGPLGDNEFTTTYAGTSVGRSPVLSTDNGEFAANGAEEASPSWASGHAQIASGRYRRLAISQSRTAVGRQMTS
jgi:hypothetical protein